MDMCIDFETIKNKLAELGYEKSKLEALSPDQLKKVLSNPKLRKTFFAVLDNLERKSVVPQIQLDLHNRLRNSKSKPDRKIDSDNLSQGHELHDPDRKLMMIKRQRLDSLKKKFLTLQEQKRLLEDQVPKILKEVCYMKGVTDESLHDLIRVKHRLRKTIHVDLRRETLNFSRVMANYASQLEEIKRMTTEEGYDGTHNSMNFLAPSTLQTFLKTEENFAKCVVEFLAKFNTSEEGAESENGKSDAMSPLSKEALERSVYERSVNLMSEFSAMSGSLLLAQKEHVASVMRLERIKFMRRDLLRKTDFSGHKWNIVFSGGRAQNKVDDYTAQYERKRREFDSLWKIALPNQLKEIEELESSKKGYSDTPLKLKHQRRVLETFLFIEEALAKQLERQTFVGALIKNEQYVIQDIYNLFSSQISHFQRENLYTNNRLQNYVHLPSKETQTRSMASTQINLKDEHLSQVVSLLSHESPHEATAISSTKTQLLEAVKNLADSYSFGATSTNNTIPQGVKASKSAAFSLKQVMRETFEILNPRSKTLSLEALVDETAEKNVAVLDSSINQLQQNLENIDKEIENTCSSLRESADGRYSERDIFVEFMLKKFPFFVRESQQYRENHIFDN